MSHIRAINDHVDPEVVQALENALAAAKEGKSRGVLIVMVAGDGGVQNCFGGHTNNFAMLGAIECAKQRLIEWIRE